MKRSDERRAQEVGRMIRKTVVGLFFHPFYKNIVFLLQEGGDIHGVDAQSGDIVAANCASV